MGAKEREQPSVMKHTHSGSVFRLPETLGTQLCFLFLLFFGGCYATSMPVVTNPSPEELQSVQAFVTNPAQTHLFQLIKSNYQ